MLDHIAKANDVIDWEGTNVVDGENNQRFRQVKDAVRISRSPPRHEPGPGSYNLSKTYRPVFTSRTSLAVSSPSLVTSRGPGQSDDGETVTVSVNPYLDMSKRRTFANLHNG